jgi:hypothetical protein
MKNKKPVNISLLPDFVFSEDFPKSKVLPAARRASLRLLILHLDVLNGHSDCSSDDFDSAIEDELRLPQILSLLRNLADIVADEKLVSRIKDEILRLES